MEKDEIMDSVRNTISNYWQEYKASGSSGESTTTTDYSVIDTGNCYISWDEPYDYYSWYPRPYTYTYHYPENKTEQAFKILKLLVKEKVIREPSSFKKFCDLIEKLAKVI